MQSREDMSGLSDTLAHSTLMSKARKVALLGVGISLAGSGLILASTTANAEDSGPAVASSEKNYTLCHTGNGKSFETVTVDFSGLTGHARTDSQDLIPPVHDGPHQFAGQNYSSDLQAYMLAHDCSSKGYEEPSGDKFTFCHSMNNTDFKKESDSASDILKYHASTTDESRNHAYDVIPSIPGLAGGRNIDTARGAYLLAHDCDPSKYDEAAAAPVSICTVNPESGGSPYVKVSDVRTDELVTPTGTAIGQAAVAGTGVYPTSGYGNIVPPIETSAYLQSAFGGTNWTLTPLGGKAIWDAHCNVIGIPTPGPTVTTPGTNTTTTVTVPGPTTTVTATPSATVSASPVGIIPSPAITAPSGGTSVSASPVGVVPLQALTQGAASAPTSVNAGEGGTQQGSVSPLGLMLMAAAGCGIAYSTLTLIARRRADSVK